MPGDLSGRARAALLLVFFCSGVSGLIYQVIWVREFGNVFGNTVQSASLVTGVFMAGLGVGALALGRAGDRLFQRDPRLPLRLYAWAELLIAGSGLFLAVLLPRLGSLAARGSVYVSGIHGFRELSFGSYAMRDGVAILLIAPATFLMGGTLTLLIRVLVRKDLEGATRSIGQLYASNTAGAAVGALLTDQALVPALGIFQTQLVAVSLNVGAAAAALLLLRASKSEASGHPGAPSLAVPASRGPVIYTAVALGLSGFAALGLEIVWFRHLSCALGESRAVFSLLLAVILTGIGLGAWLGAWMHGRLGHPALLLLVAECLFAIAALGLLVWVNPQALADASRDQMKLAFEHGGRWVRPLLELWVSARPIAAAVFVPAVLMGVSYPLANANVQRVEAALGGRAGLLYLANCAGSVAGSVVVGFVLLPALGVQRSAWILAAIAGATALPLYLSARGRGEARRLAIAAITSTGLLAIVWAAYGALGHDFLARRTVPAEMNGPHRRILELGDGLNETLAVTEIPGFMRELFTNGHSMSSTHPKAQRYMRAFAHVPLLQMDEPKHALVICFGVGTTTHAASLHSTLMELEVADLSRSVLERAHWFEASNERVLEDPRVAVFVDDGRHHLVTRPLGAYDLITLEPPPIYFAGVAALYSREFYSLARSRLTARGFITQWLPAYQVPEAEVRAIVRAFIDVFPESVLLSGDDNELILMGTRGPSIQMDPDAVLRRLAGEPRVAADLARVDLGDMTEIAGMFAASYATMMQATRSVPPVTDDRPSLEYSVHSQLRDMRMPRDMFDVHGIDAWCPSCIAKLPGLRAYLEVRGTLYASEWFLVTSSIPAPVPDLRAMPGALAAIASSRYLQRLLGSPGLPARRVAELNFQKGLLVEAEEALETARSMDPYDPDTYLDLAQVFGALGRPEVAARARAMADELRQALRSAQ